MKRKITMVFIIALVAGGMAGFAGDGNGASGNRCNPAGTWYAELPSPPYVATITPVGFPAKIPDTPARRSVNEMVHYR